MEEAKGRRKKTSCGMPWIKCLGRGDGKARRGKSLSVSQPVHLLVKVSLQYLSQLLLRVLHRN